MKRMSNAVMVMVGFLAGTAWGGLTLDENFGGGGVKVPDMTGRVRVVRLTAMGRCGRLRLKKVKR